MDERRKATLRLLAKSSLYAFFFPVVFMLAFSPLGVWPILMAGAFSALTGGPAFTLLFGLLIPATKRFAFAPAILIQIVSILVCGGALFLANIFVVTAIVLRKLPNDGAVVADVSGVLAHPTMHRVFAYSIVLFVLLTMFEQVRRKLGGNVIWDWVTGKYHRPREEERVFMFLDLKDSTPIAEELGPLKFSSLVQEFFNDVGYVVAATRGSVSHYIGDEAVIVWRPERAFRDANCVRLFFKLSEEIYDRADEYRRLYGLVPSFKAGVHVGPVVAAEVGRVKSEVMYHGDAVNTTARIVGMCAELGRDLLVSKDVADKLADSEYVTEPMGQHQLKGKAEPVEIYAVTSAPS